MGWGQGGAEASPPLPAVGSLRVGSPSPPEPSLQTISLCLRVTLGTKGASDFGKWSNTSEISLRTAFRCLGCQAKRSVCVVKALCLSVCISLYSCLFKKSITHPSLLRSSFSGPDPGSVPGLSNAPSPADCPGSSKKGHRRPCYWFLGHVTHGRVIYNERSQAPASVS